MESGKTMEAAREDDDRNISRLSPNGRGEDRPVVSPHFPGPSLHANVVFTFTPVFYKALLDQGEEAAREEKLDFFPLACRNRYSICRFSPGAPMAVYGLERVRALGAETVLVFGCCGSLKEDLKIGDVLLVEGALSEEGTSPHYPGYVPFPKGDPEFVLGLETLLSEASIPFKKGSVWTTDALFRETERKVLAMKEKGIAAVEMELSALFTASRFLGISLGALMVISDELWSLTHKSGFADSRFHRAVSRLAGEVDRFFKKN